MKRIKTIIAMVLASVFVFSLSACGSDAELDEWSAPTYSDVVRGSEVEVQPLTVKDSKGTEYTANVVVSRPGGYGVDLVGGKFIADSLGEYTIRYTIVFNSKSVYKDAKFSTTKNLDDLKDDAKSELDEFVSTKLEEGGYSDEKVSLIENLLSQAKNNIDAASTAEQISSIKASAIASLNNIDPASPVVGMFEYEDEATAPFELSDVTSNSATVKYSTTAGYKAVKVLVEDWTAPFKILSLTVTNKKDTQVHVHLRITASGSSSDGENVLNGGNHGEGFYVAANSTYTIRTLVTDSRLGENTVKGVFIYLDSHLNTLPTLDKEAVVELSDLHFERLNGIFVGPLAVLYSGDGADFTTAGDTVAFSFSSSLTSNPYKGIKWTIANFTDFIDETPRVRITVINHSGISFKFDYTATDSLGDKGQGDERTVVVSNEPQVFYEYAWASNEALGDIIQIHMNISPAEYNGVASEGTFTITIEFVE